MVLTIVIRNDIICINDLYSLKRVLTNYRKNKKYFTQILYWFANSVSFLIWEFNILELLKAISSNCI